MVQWILRKTLSESVLIIDGTIVLSRRSEKTLYRIIRDVKKDPHLNVLKMSLFPLVDYGFDPPRILNSLVKPRFVTNLKKLSNLYFPST